MDLGFEEGILISRSGLAKRASTCADCCEMGVRARFFVGRLERGSADVGMDSGMGSDMLVLGWSTGCSREFGGAVIARE